MADDHHASTSNEAVNFIVALGAAIAASLKFISETLIHRGKLEPSRLHSVSGSTNGEHILLRILCRKLVFESVNCVDVDVYTSTEKSCNLSNTLGPVEGTTFLQAGKMRNGYRLTTFTRSGAYKLEAEVLPDRACALRRCAFIVANLTAKYGGLWHPKHLQPSTMGRL